MAGQEKWKGGDGRHGNSATLDQTRYEYPVLFMYKSSVGRSLRISPVFLQADWSASWGLKYPGQSN